MAKNFTLLSKIVNNRGTVLNPITSVQKIEPFSTIEIAHTGKIQKPLLWLPETPTLYKVQTGISDNGNIIDRYEANFGVRTIEINRKEFF